MATSDVEKSLQSYLKLPYSRVLIPDEDGRCSAEVLEFPGCIAQGRNAGEAFANLEEAAKLWITSCLHQGKEIPPPAVNYGYSGKFVLRLPRDLHRLASRKAERDAVSLNQCLVSAVAAWVGADNLFERLISRFQRAPLTIYAQFNMDAAASTISLPGHIQIPNKTAAVDTSRKVLTDA